MFFRVLAHIKPHKADSKHLSHRLCKLCLSHSGRSDEQETPHRFILLTQARLRQLDGIGQLIHRRLLTEDSALQLPLQACQLLPFLRLHRLLRNPADLRQHLFHQLLIHHLDLLVFGMQLQIGPRLVN